MIFTDIVDVSSLLQDSLQRPLILVGSEFEDDQDLSYDYTMLRRVRELGCCMHRCPCTRVVARINMRLTCNKAWFRCRHCTVQVKEAVARGRHVVLENLDSIYEVSCLKCHPSL